MPIIVTAAKGGSGATTIAAAIVLASTQAGSTPTLVDLEGDAGAAFRSISRPDGAPTVDEWLRSAAPPERLDELAAATEPAVLSWAVDRDSSLETTPARPERWRELHAWCVRRELRTGSPVVIEARWIAARLRDDRGQATTEYALVLLAAALVALLVIAWATAGGGGARVNRLFNRVVDAVIDRV